MPDTDTVRDPRVLLEATGIDVRFDALTVLSDVGVKVHEGEIVTIIGPNGSGKTTLVRVVLGLLEPARGRVALRPGLRIGYMPQHLRVDETLPLTVTRFLRLGGAATSGEMRRVLQEVGAVHLGDSQIHDISGGEMRRVLLARALLRDPDLLVLDEPLQGVDVIGQSDLYRLITRVRDRRGCGVLMISHDLHVVMAATDQVVCLNRHVCCTGRPEAVTRHPEYLALFGPQAADALAVYTHRHDHRHDGQGEVVPIEPGDDDAGQGGRRGG
ncbi:MAG: zinc ABC transporter ATP-binding protein ZnuC [Alphaproteobacteria bacterium]